MNSLLFMPSGERGWGWGVRKKKKRKREKKKWRNYVLISFVGRYYNEKKEKKKKGKKKEEREQKMKKRGFLQSKELCSRHKRL